MGGLTLVLQKRLDCSIYDLVRLDDISRKALRNLTVPKNKIKTSRQEENDKRNRET